MLFSSRRAVKNGARTPRFRSGPITLLAVLLIANGMLPALPAPRSAFADDLSFASRRTYGSGNDHTAALALGDIDGDGSLDIVAVSDAGQNVVYLNHDGKGIFYNGPLDCTRDADVRCFGTGSDTTKAVALGDIDANGTLDIVVGNGDASGQQDVVYLNDGTGHFASGSITCGVTPNVRCFGTGADNTQSVALADVNNDAKLDIAVGNDNQQSAIYLNDGSGNFTNGPFTCGGVTASVRCFGAATDNTKALAFGSVAGTMGLVAGKFDQQSAIYLTGGTGDLSSLVSFGNPGDGTTSIAIGDVNRDTIPEIVAGNAVAPSVLYTFSSFFPSITLKRNELPRKSETGANLLAARSVVFGDVKGNGYLDLVFGNEGPNIAYLSGLPDLQTPLPAYASPTFDEQGRSVALGDVDGDGDLDLILGKNGQNAIYINNGPGRLPQSTDDFVRPFGDAGDHTTSVALGDVDGNGQIDLAVGKTGGQSAVYLNDGAGRFNQIAPHPFGEANDSITSVALGDLDGDHDLDLAVGRASGQSTVYLNDGAGNFATERLFGGTNDSIASVALGDIDNDGDLDLVAGRTGGQSAVYLNDGSGTFATARPFGGTNDMTAGVALGDIDGNGDLDIVTNNAIYLNDGFGSFPVAHTLGGGQGGAGVAVGDVSGDGKLDIVVGNKVFINDGFGQFYTGFVTCGVTPNVRCLDTTALSVALADVDNDSDVDIVVGSAGQNIIYLNNGTGNFATESIICGFSPGAHCFDDGNGPTPAVAVGDVDNDGYPDFVAGKDSVVNKTVRQSAVYINGLTKAPEATRGLPQVTVTRPGPTANAALFSTPTILSNDVIPINYTLQSDDNTRVRFVRAFYSLDGGGKWQPAIAASNTITTDLETASSGKPYVYNWDTFKSGVFGQSNNVIFRIEAYPSPRPTSSAIVGPFQRPYLAAQTFPFRVRGTQVQVYRETVAPGNEAADAVVYRLPAGQTGKAALLASDIGQPFHTDTRGYLQGRGQVQPGDQLVALMPISSTSSYTIYLTSALPTATGLQMNTVTQLGVQTLTVSAANPLMLLNLNVSLEWDARYDAQFMERLRSDLQRTSESLYDWSNGQIALGQITIYHDRQHWDDADVRIYASNRVRPNAAQGGIVTDLFTETTSLQATRSVTSPVVYEPGQVHIGAIWNRYGESSGNLSEDWPRTLAHELGHYALYLNDNYIGLNDQGVLVAMDGCKGAMSDPYRDDYTEFHPNADWETECKHTLSNQTTGRSDWATVTTFYPQLHAPTTSLALTNQGPTSLPLAVTDIQFVTPITPTQALDVPIFYLKKNGAIYQPGADARAFLFRNDRLIDLGRPALDQLTARGARPDDRVCVYELTAELEGCEVIHRNDEQLDLVSHAGWQPELSITPVTSTTINVSVSHVPSGVTLKAKLFPINDADPSSTITLSPLPGTATSSGSFALDDVAPEGYVQVWVDEPEPRREIVTDYALGGSPGFRRGNGGFRRGNGGFRRGNGGFRRGNGAPVASADGQVVLFGEDLVFKPGEFFAFQAATSVPRVPSWATVVGQAYQVTTSPNAPSLANTSISFTYLGNEVPTGEEEGLRVYFWNGSTWRQLSTSLDTYNNNAAAPTQGPGLYALMSSVEVPIRNPGWNLFAYPVRATHSVSEALASINGHYTTVYGYNGNDLANPWKVYDTTAPAWVNDLHTLEYGQGYWINATEAITVLLKGGSTISQTQAFARAASSIPSPPATYYGTVQAGSGFAPQAGLSVQALVNGTPCGSSTTSIVDGQLVYSVKVLAADTNSPDCGAPGRTVTFTVNGRGVAPAVAWDNSRVREVTLSLPLVYLPVVVR